MITETGSKFRKSNIKIKIQNNILKTLTLVLFYSLSVFTYGQDTLKIDSSGYKLKEFYLSLNVSNLWLAGHRINWETGEPDTSNTTTETKTHCSAFVASACKRLGIYILRPPEHGQVLLSNAQYEWLFTNEAQEDGWKHIDGDDFKSAQQYANSGSVVVAVYKNPNKKKAGHIALVMPAETDNNILNEEGPNIIQAGIENSDSINLREGFKHHIKDWPESDIVFFYNEKKIW